MRAKGIIASVVGFVVAVVLVMLGYDLTPQKVADFLNELLGRSPKIVISPPRDSFLAGEKVRFLLQRVPAHRVLWVLDDGAMAWASVEVEHAFAQNSTENSGWEDVHRVDALFAVGDLYQDLYTHVKIRNIIYKVKVDVQSSELSVTADTKLAAGEESRRKKPGVPGGFTLVGASLAKYSDGKFSKVGSLAIQQKNSSALQLAIGKDKAIQALGYKQTDNLKESPISTDPAAWVAYDFAPTKAASKEAKPVEIFQPVALLLNSGA
jgi:hypothetical protein